MQLDASVRLYDAFLPLLTEDIRTQQFVAEEHTREEYLAEVKRLQGLELQIRHTCPNLLRMNLAVIDCSELNEHLRSKATSCVTLLLSGVVESTCNPRASTTQRRSERNGRRGDTLSRNLKTISGSARLCRNDVLSSAQSLA